MAEFSDAKSGAYCMCTREKCSDECRTYRRFRPKPITNADRIRAMSDEELAVQLALHYLISPPWCSEQITCPYINEDPTPCDKCALDWLREVDNAED